jgi:uncharacterized membrane protein YqjE
MPVQRDADVTERRLVEPFDSIKSLAASLVSHLHTRLALFATELAVEKLRLSSILFGALLTLFFLFLAVFFVAIFVVAVWWDTRYRLHSIGGLAGLFLAGAGIAGWIVRARFKSESRPFAMSLAELYKDRQELNSR